VKLYANITDIQASDDHHVTFTLAEPNSEFLLDLADWHAGVVDADIKDLSVEFNGTGPFMIDQFLTEDRITFKANPNYWRMGEDGKPLPYVDGMEWLFLSAVTARVDALQGGQIHFIHSVPAEYQERLRGVEGITVATNRSNWHLAINVRCDVEPFTDVRVRKALKLATDRSAILATAIGGRGFLGADTPIGPIYGDYYLDEPEMKRDVAAAKALLAEAGHPDGIKFTLTVADALGAPQLATIWQQQVTEAGIVFDIQLMPSDTFYSTGTWLNADATIVDWGPRLNPLPYLKQAYTCDGAWTSAHFCSAELDELANKITPEPDRAKRAEMYHRVQQILREEGGTIVPYHQDQAIAYRKELNPGPVAGFMPSAFRLDEVCIQS
jgi:peptide/nickel transport system substrate-binding protein